MLTTNIERIGGNAVIDLDTKDLLSNNLIRTVSRELSQTPTSNAIINLEQISALSSGEWSEICALSQALELIGINSLLCGINPAVAMTLIELVEPVPIKTFLNVDGALDALQTHR